MKSPMCRLPKLLPVILIAAFSAFPAMADVIVGLPADSDNGNCFPFGCSYSGQYQQVYTSSQFPAPITITDLHFFNTEYDSGATAMNSGTWTISLSTTSADWNTLSDTYASNIGGDNTQVFSGDLSQPWAFGDTLNIIFSTPFHYDPAQGNLLLDVFVTNASAPGGDIYFDTNGLRTPNSIMGRVYFGDVEAGYGLVTEFTTSAVPEPGTCAMLLAGLGLVGFMKRDRKQKTD